MARYYWNDKQQELLDWLSVPYPKFLSTEQQQGRASNITALAEKLGVSRDTLYAWQKLPGFDEALREATRKTINELGPFYMMKFQSALMQFGRRDYSAVSRIYFTRVIPALEENQLRVINSKDTDTKSKAIYSRGITRLQALSDDRRQEFISIWQDIYNEVMQEEESSSISNSKVESKDKVNQIMARVC
jgi:hypothetical protein